MADLTTLAAVKAYAGITGTAQDVLLSGLITRASAAIENYLQRSVMSGSVAEVRDGTGATAMLLRQWPVASVASLMIDGQTIPAASAWGAPGWWLADGRTILLFGYRFARGIANVQASYTAGYATVPADIEQACIETVLLALKRRDHIDVSSKSLAGESITFVNVELPRAAQQVLANHRRVSP